MKIKQKYLLKRKTLELGLHLQEKKNLKLGLNNQISKKVNQN